MRRKSRPAPEAPPADPYPITFETFRKIGTYEQRNFTDTEPSCFNGIVSVERFRVTVERVAEPKDVVAARLQSLWERSNNIHDLDPLKRAAKRLGVELHGRWGEARRPS